MLNWKVLTASYFSGSFKFLQNSLRLTVRTVEMGRRRRSVVGVYRLLQVALRRRLSQVAVSVDPADVLRVVVFVVLPQKQSWAARSLKHHDVTTKKSFFFAKRTLKKFEILQDEKTEIFSPSFESAQDVRARSGHLIARD